MGAIISMYKLLRLEMTEKMIYLCHNNFLLCTVRVLLSLFPKKSCISAQQLPAAFAVLDFL